MGYQQLTPEQQARDRRILAHLWTVLEHAPEKIVEHVLPPTEQPVAVDCKEEQADTIN